MFRLLIPQLLLQGSWGYPASMRQQILSVESGVQPGNVVQAPVSVTESKKKSVESVLENVYKDVTDTAKSRKMTEWKREEIRTLKRQMALDDEMRVYGLFFGVALTFAAIFCVYVAFVLIG